MGRAAKKGKVIYQIINLRDFGEGKHQLVDDRPFGGGAGMVLKADVLAKAVNFIKDRETKTNFKPQVILTQASGTPYSQKKAYQLLKSKHLIIVCGHYEGVDQRFIDHYVDLEISIGDYVLTGGELAALVITDSIVRLIPGVLEKEQATKVESFSEFEIDQTPKTLLEGPHYTRPDQFEGEEVPRVLKSGNHQAIMSWRNDQALQKTKLRRPDLLKKPK